MGGSDLNEKVGQFYLTINTPIFYYFHTKYHFSKFKYDVYDYKLILFR